MIVTSRQFEMDHATKADEACTSVRLMNYLNMTSNVWPSDGPRAWGPDVDRILEA